MEEFFLEGGEDMDSTGVGRKKKIYAFLISEGPGYLENNASLIPV